MATVLARGHKQVGELEVFLGGKPPAHAITQSKAALTKYARTYFEQQNAEQSRFASLMAKTRERMLSSLGKDDPTLQKDIAEAKRFLKQHASRPIAKPRAEKVESQFVIGSQFTAKAAPFDAEFIFGSVAHANKNTGTYDIAMQVIGRGSNNAAAGVMARFWSTEADPQKGCRAWLHFSYEWWDSSAFYVAHNNYRTRLWIFGEQEEAFVAQADMDPQWSDGTGWLEKHGGKDSATRALEIRFPARAQSGYQVWVWSTGWISASSGPGGFGAASLQASDSVPVISFGDL